MTADDLAVGLLLLITLVVAGLIGWVVKLQKQANNLELRLEAEERGWTQVLDKVEALEHEWRD